MKIGLQYNTRVTKKEIRDAGIDILGAEYEELFFAGSAKVVRINAAKLEQAVLDGALENLSISGTEVLVTETIGLKNREEVDKFAALLIKCMPGFKDKGLTVCIENGYLPEGEKIYRGPLADGSALAQFIDDLNDKAGDDMFKAAFNVGCARALKLQIPEHIKALGSRIRVLYISDNDGNKDLRQLPYTFTTVHSINCAEWDAVTEYFNEYPQDVFIIGDLKGTFAVCPAELKSTFLQLAKAVLGEWESRMENRQITLPIGEE